MSSFSNARSAPAIRRLCRSAALVAGVGLACDPPPSSTAGWEKLSAGGDAPVNTSPACGKPSASRCSFARKVTVFGKARTYTLVVPAGYSAALSYPLIYVLHGNGGSGAEVRSSFDIEGASAGRALFVYPDALGGQSGGWDLDSPAGKNGDVALFDATLALVQSEYCIDLHRVFVAGFSNGAYMANQLACRRGDRIRGTATHSGGGPYEIGADAKYDDHGEVVCNGKPVASLVIHGAADTTVAPSEGQKSIDHWVAANHCGAPQKSGPCASYGGCSNAVVACKVHGLGHAVWPEAPKRAWSFFDDQK